MWVFPKIGMGPQNGWFMKENPVNPWMIWGTTIFGNIHVLQCFCCIGLPGLYTKNVNVCRRVSVTTIPTKPASQMPVTPHFNGKESTWFEETTHQQNFFNLPMKRTHKFRKRYIQVVSKSSVVSVARKNSYSQTVSSWT